VSSRPCWDDAMRATERLTRGDRRTLSLLTRVPFAWAGLLRQLAGLHGDRSIYRSVNRLLAIGLIGAHALPSRPTYSPHLLYLTDLGIATVAIEWGTSPEDVARRYRLRRTDLLRRLIGLPPLLASYELLGALAATVAGRPVLHVWEYPWHVRFHNRTTGPVRVTSTTGYASFTWKGDEATAARFLLIADTGTRPITSYRTDVLLLMRLRDLQSADVPTLIVATRDEDRVETWTRFFIEVEQSRHDAPPSTRIATWDQLRAGVRVRWQREAAVSTPLPVASTGLPPQECGPLNRPLPRLVGGSPLVHASPASQLHEREHCVVRLTERDRMVIALIGRHPFLTSDKIAIVFGWEKGATRQRTARLLTHGAVRTLLPAEIDGRTVKRDLLELTHAGVQNVAAQDGLLPWLARRHHGLTGHQLNGPLGPREDLLRYLEHTLGVNDCFVDLCRVSATASSQGQENCGLVAWHNAAVCATPFVRPDAYGLYRCRGLEYGFFFEYDRGTMSVRDLIKKFKRYQAYKESQHYAQLDGRFPVVLVVTTSPTSEHRVLSAIRVASRACDGKIHVLVSTIERIEAAPLGMLGTVWRGTAAEGTLCRWPLEDDREIMPSSLSVQTDPDAITATDWEP